MKFEIELCGRRIPWTLRRKKTGQLQIRVSEDGGVLVSAPFWVSLAQTERFLQSNSKALLESLDRLADQRPQWLSGEHLFVDGYPFVLAVTQGPMQILLDGDELLLRVPNPESRDMRRKALLAWLQERCRQRVLAYCDQMQTHFTPQPQIRFRNMHAQWGNCRKEREIITFSYALAAVPDDCVAYVVWHEYLHLLHPNHGPEFYKALNAVLPDWEDRKNRLLQGNFMKQHIHLQKEN